jgi:hypothetical protein
MTASVRIDTERERSVTAMVEQVFGGRPASAVEAQQ